PSFDHRVLPPSVATRQPPTRSADSGVKPARADLPAAEPVPTSPSPGEPAPPVTDGRRASGPLSLPDAIALAYRMQPRLRAFLEGVVRGRGPEQVAVAPFLPAAVAGYSVGGFDLNAGGEPVPFGASTPNFTFLPFTGAVPVGLNLHTGYELAELRVQW